MSTFSPRDLLVNPTQFGRAKQPQWHPVGDTPRDRASAALALAQHRLAVAVAEEIAERGCTQGELAAEIGVARGTFGKKLRGHDPLSATDLFAWVLHLGRIELWPAPNNLDELVP